METKITDADNNTKSTHSLINDPLCAMQEDIAKTRQFEQKQLKLSRIRTLISLVTLALVVAILISIAPTVNGILNNLDHVATELASVDIDGLTKSVSELTKTAQTGISDLSTSALVALKGVDNTLKSVNSIDVYTLNKSIHDLSNIVEPLSKLFK